MNKRDFLKTTAALAVAPAIISRTKLAAASIADRQAMRAERKKLGPKPSYIFDSDKNSMTFFKADINSFSTYAYMSA